MVEGKPILDRLWEFRNEIVGYYVDFSIIFFSLRPYY